MRYLPFLFLLTLFACEQEAFQPLSTDQAPRNAAEVTPAPASTDLHPSILASDWWQSLSPATRQFAGAELSGKTQPVTLQDLEARFQRTREKAAAAGCGGFPTPNPEGNVTLNSQADVDAFGALKCKDIIGALEIVDTLGPDPIVDLTPLSKLKSVGSSLTINSDGLTDLDGLQKLKTIGLLGPFGFIGVNGDNLTDISALSSLKTVTGSINIIDCASLTSVTTAFSKLKVIAPNQTPDSVFSIFTLNIASNALLTDLSGFAGITTMDILLIQSNGALADLDDLTALATIVDDIRIFENTALQNIDELDNITSLGGNVFVFDNPVLSACCGLYGLLCADPPTCSANNVGGNVFIFNNDPACEEATIISGGACP